MTSDLDTYRTAAIVVGEHGEDATTHAAMRADPATDSADVHERALAKLAEVKRKIAHLEDMRGALENLISACPGGGALRTCSIMESLVSANPHKWREENDEERT